MIIRMFHLMIVGMIGKEIAPNDIFYMIMLAYYDSFLFLCSQI